MNKNKGILLVELPPWDPRTPPLGIAYLDACLEQEGLEVNIYDLNIDMYKDAGEEDRKGWGNEDLFWWLSKGAEEKNKLLASKYAQRILSHGYKILGFSATIPSLPFLKPLLEEIKKKSKDTVVILGGPAMFFKQTRWQYYNRRYVDYIVIGDGEKALIDLMRRLKGNSRLASLSHGLKRSIDRRKSCIVGTTVMDLDSLPFPSFKHYDLSLYTEGTKSTDFTLPMLFSKGCTRKCTFCSDRVLSYPYRCRKPERVCQEMKFQIEKYANKCFRLNDLSFNANLIFLDKLCDCIIREGINVKWYGQAQVLPSTSKELFAKLKKAGCAQFSLGLESFSDHVLGLMKKGYSAKEASQFLKDSSEAGISNHIAIIVGYPGETDEDFQQTLRNIEINAPYIERICSLNICGMPVGSDFREHPQEYDYIYDINSGDWVSNDGANNYQLRKRRYNEVIMFCNKLKIPVDACLDLACFEEHEDKRAKEGKSNGA